MFNIPTNHVSAMQSTIVHWHQITPGCPVLIGWMVFILQFPAVSTANLKIFNTLFDDRDDDDRKVVVLFSYSGGIRTCDT